MIIAEVPRPTVPVEVDHPAHYTRGKIETIDFIEDKGLGFNLGNVVKYVSRAGYKEGNDATTDLMKARWYLEREINRLSNKESSK